jgi:hypothetical protein
MVTLGADLTVYTRSVITWRRVLQFVGEHVDELGLLSLGEWIFCLPQKFSRLVDTNNTVQQSPRYQPLHYSRLPVRTLQK